MLSRRYVAELEEERKEENNIAERIKTVVSLQVTVYPSISIGEYAISSTD